MAVDTVLVVNTVLAITDLEGLDALEADWSSVHRADPEATVFTSWAWIRGRLSALTEPWSVLVARAGGKVVGLLPLRSQPATREDAGAPALAMAGSPLADYTGFLCGPGFEEAVLAAFASHFRDDLDWRRFEIHDALDARLELFLGHFPEPRFQIERHRPTPCPFLELDESWEAYLRARPRPRLRREIRHDLRAIERLPGLRRTTVADGGEAQISTLLELWQGRWGAVPEPKLEEYRSVFRSCLEAGLLWLDVLWDGDVPITGLLAFLDRKKSSFCFYITGFNERYAAYSPGTVMVARAIREAIGDGYRTFDFLRGDEPYKFSFGARVRHTQNVTLRTAD